MDADWILDEPGHLEGSVGHPDVKLSPAQAESARRAVLGSAALGEFDMGNSRARRLAFHERGLWCGPTFISSDTGRAECHVFYRSCDNAVTRMEPVELPDITYGFVYLDPERNVFFVKCAQTQQERERLVEESLAVISKMDRKNLESFVLRMIGRMNRVAVELGPAVPAMPKCPVPEPVEG